MTSPHSDRAGRLPRWAFALGVILALGALASSAFAQPMLLTGADRAVWLVRIRDANTFDVLAKPAGDAWRWVASDLRGQPVAIAADTGLRMICHGGDQLFFALGGGSPTPAAKISAGSVVALCGAADSSRSEPLTYAVVVQRVPPTATARAVLQPATATRPGELVRLGVYRGSGDAWSRVADTDVLEHFPGTRVLAAALGKTVYVLAGDDRAQRLFAVQDGSSRPVQLPPPAPSRRPLGMLAMSGRVLLILAEPAEKPDQVVVRIATYDPAKGFNEPLHPMTRDGQLVTWPMNDPPLPARLADRIALVWREGQRLRFTTCSDKGVLAPSEDVDVLEHPPVPGGAQDVLYYFLWGTVIATTIPLLLSRPTSPPRPLTLPAYMQPAGLLKRLLIDADLRCGLVHAVFGCRRQPGFAELLCGTSRFEDGAWRVPVGEKGELVILPSGVLLPTPGRGLEIERVREVLAWLAPQFDLVLIDTPPVNVLADAALLGSAADAVVLVVRAGHTGVEALRYAMDQLAAARAPVAGTLLNDIDLRQNTGDGSYRYLAEVERYYAGRR